MWHKYKQHHHKKYLNQLNVDRLENFSLIKSDYYQFAYDFLIKLIIIDFSIVCIRIVSV
jgi:hypothetical protein